MIGINALVAIILLIINIFVLIYLDNLEKIGCKCAFDWRRTYAYVYTIIFLIYAFVVGVIYASISDNMSENSIVLMENIITAITGIMVLAGILYIIFSLQYIHNLRNIKCECSKHLTRDVWEIVLYIEVALAFFGILLFVLSVFTTKSLIEKIPFYKNMKLDKLEKKMTNTLKGYSSKKSTK